MIKRIKVSNFYSINEEIEIDFLVQEKCVEMKTGRYVQCGDDKINKLCFLIGPNGSGKTNVLSVFRLIYDIFSGGDFSKSYVPTFAPTRQFPNFMKGDIWIKIEFSTSNKKYSYGAKIYSNFPPDIKYEAKFVFEELKSNDKTLIIRDELNKNMKINIDGLESTKIDLNKVSTGVSIIHFINKIFQNNEIDGICKYFNTACNIFPGYNSIEFVDFIPYLGKDMDFYLLVSKIVKKVDLGISDIFERDKFLKILNSYNEMDLDKALKQLGQAPLFYHDIDGEKMVFPIGTESLGTQTFIGVVAKLYYAIKNSSFLVIDEIDNSLHPELIRFLIDMAVKSDNPVQLIASTHNAEIISQLYPDEVYFVEKKNGATDVYSAKDFKDIECTDNLYAKYRALRLGAYPKVERIDKEQLNGTK